MYNESGTGNSNRELKTGNTAGSDDITTCILNALYENGMTLIHELCNQIFMSGKTPKYMNESVLVQRPQ